MEPGRRRDPRGRRLPAAAREAGTGPAGARRPGLRLARQAGVRRAAAARAAARRHPLRRAAGGPRAARHCRRPGARRCRTCSRSGSSSTTRWTPAACSACARRWSGPRRAACSRTTSNRSSMRRSDSSAARPANVNRAATRCRTFRPPGTPPRPAQVQRGPRRRARPWHDAPRALLHRARPAGRRIAAIFDCLAWPGGPRRDWISSGGFANGPKAKAYVPAGGCAPFPESIPWARVRRGPCHF